MEREPGPPQWTARLPFGAGWMDANLTHTSAKATSFEREIDRHEWVIGLAWENTIPCHGITIVWQNESLALTNFHCRIVDIRKCPQRSLQKAASRFSRVNFCCVDPFKLARIKAAEIVQGHGRFKCRIILLVKVSTASATEPGTCWRQRDEGDKGDEGRCVVKSHDFFLLIGLWFCTPTFWIVQKIQIIFMEQRSKPPAPTRHSVVALGSCLLLLRRRWEYRIYSTEWEGVQSAKKREKDPRLRLCRAVWSLIE